jgi:hypothetical protein
MSRYTRFGCWIVIAVVGVGCGTSSPDAGSVAVGGGPELIGAEGAPAEVPEGLPPESVEPDAGSLPSGVPSRPPTPREPLPAHVPTSVALPELELTAVNFLNLGFTEDGQRLLFLSDLELFQRIDNPAYPWIGTLHVLEIASGLLTLIDTRVVLELPFGHKGVHWSDDGKTVVYGRIPDDASELSSFEQWEFTAHLDLHVWREGEAVRPLGMVQSQVWLAPSGNRVLAIGETSNTMVEYRLDEEGSTQWEIPHKPAHLLSYEVHRASGSFVYELDGVVSVRQLDDGSEEVLSDEGVLMRVTDGFVLFTLGDALAGYDLHTGQVSPSLIKYTDGWVRLLDLDREHSLALIMVWVEGSYEVLVWSLDSGEGEEVVMPGIEGDPPTSGEFTDDGFSYTLPASHFDKDLWYWHDSEHSLVLENHCQTMALIGVEQRLLRGNEAGCSAAFALDRLYLMDEDTLTLTDSGRDVVSVRGALSEGRVVYERDADGVDELVMWDVNTGETTALAFDPSFDMHIARGGEWFFAGYAQSDELDSLVVVHPGGVTHLNEAPSLHDFAGTEDHLAMIFNVEGGQQLRITSFEDMVTVLAE